MRTTRLRAVALAVALTASCLVLSGTPASADTITVTTTGDTIDGGDDLTSLREAFAAASASPGPDSIELAAATTYALTDCASGALTDGGTGDLTVVGNGAAIEQTCDDTGVITKSQESGWLALHDVTLTGGANTGVNLVGSGVYSEGRLTLDGVTITGTSNSDGGSAIAIGETPASPDLELIDSVVEGNPGTGIVNVDISVSVSVTGSSISNNTGSGFLLIDATPLTVVDSTVNDNGLYGIRGTGQGNVVLSLDGSTVSGNGRAGAYCSSCRTLAVSDSTVSGNGLSSPAGDGGGIWFSTDQNMGAPAPSFTIAGSTVADNSASHDGGGVAFEWAGAPEGTEVAAFTVTDSAVTGNESACLGCDGGGIAAQVGSLAVDGTEIAGNTTTGQGGGIHHARLEGDDLPAPTALTITDSVLSGNTAGTSGGGANLYANTMQVARVLITGNSAATGGGLALAGVPVSGAPGPTTASVIDSTVSGNTAGTSGGGIAVRLPDTSQVSVANSTLHANTATVGGGLVADESEDLAIRHVTLTANTAATGANIASSAPTSVGASAVGDPAGGGANCAPFTTATALTSTGFSWYDDGSCSAGPGDLVDPGGDPQLGPLADNGGPTPTRLPSVGSPLGGRQPAPCVLPTDQRGETRPQGAACDAGAVEFAEASAITGTPGNDALVGTSAGDTVLGLAGHDALFGLAGDDVLDGGPGNDVLTGGPGNDILRGGTGVDVLIGGPGANTLIGGPGPDLCYLPNRLLPRDC